MQIYPLSNTPWLPRMIVRTPKHAHVFCQLIRSPGSADANQAVHISLLKPGKTSPQVLSTFHPQFTYSIFGNEEVIAGYQGLRIDLKLTAHDLQSYLGIHYERKHKTVGDSQATDIEGCLKPFIPERM